MGRKPVSLVLLVSNSLHVLQVVFRIFEGYSGVFKIVNPSASLFIRLLNPPRKPSKTRGGRSPPRCSAKVEVVNQQKEWKGGDDSDEEQVQTCGHAMASNICLEDPGFGRSFYKNCGL